MVYSVLEAGAMVYSVLEVGTMMYSVLEVGGHGVFCVRGGGP